MSTQPEGSDRLESWKEIAGYLGRSVRTVIRWERTEGLPVHRHLHEKRASIYANRAEIDTWWQRRAKAESHAPARRRAWIAVAFAVAVTAVGSIGYLRWHARPPALPVVTPEVLTSYPGYQTLPALSPDGSHLAFTWMGSESPNVDIYVQTIGSSEPRRLTDGPEADFSPAWSPDGKWLAFLRRAPNWRTSVLLKPPLGGPERKVADLELALVMDAHQVTWSPDSAWLVVPDRAGGQQGLFLFSTETGKRRRLTQSSLYRGHKDPQFSPDGRHLAFNCENVEYRSEICILELDSKLEPRGEPEVLTTMELRATSPVWSSDGRSIFFSAGYFLSDSGIYRMTVFPESARSRQPEKLISEGIEQYALATSRLGGALVYVQRYENANLWAIERKKGVWKQPVLLDAFDSNRSERSPDLSPDGRFLAFTSNRDGPMEAWIGNRDGSRLRRVTSLGAEAVWGVRWSPDGRQLAVYTGMRYGALYVVPEGGGEPRKLASGGALPCWSPDGEWIYYSRVGAGIFKVRPTGGPEVQVMDKGASAPALTQDGQLLYFQEKGGIWSRPLSGEAKASLAIPGTFRSFALGSDGVFTITNEPPYRLIFHPFSGGPPVTLTAVRDPYTGFGVSRDGDTVIYSSLEPARTNIMRVRGL